MRSPLLTNGFSMATQKNVVAAPQADQEIEETAEVQANTQVEPQSAPIAESLEKGTYVHLRSVYGHMHHPFQLPLTFETNKSTKVEVDNWVLAQVDAGKLTLYTDD